jgi:hypothetical protein
MSRTEVDGLVVLIPLVTRDVADEDAKNQREAKDAANQDVANQDVANQYVANQDAANQDASRLAEIVRLVASPIVAHAGETPVRPARQTKMNSASSTTLMTRLLSHPNSI